MHKHKKSTSIKISTLLLSLIHIYRVLENRVAQRTIVGERYRVVVRVKRAARIAWVAQRHLQFVRVSHHVIASAQEEDTHTHLRERESARAREIDERKKRP